ncbi:MAG TPA: extracellular solute-binding protein [Candidatus Paceibacterota bacterium]
MKQLSMFQIVLLAVFGALGVAGVLVFALAVGRNSGDQVGVVSIWGTLDERAFSAVIRHMTDNDQRLSQVTYTEKDPTKYREQLTEALAAGSGPELFLLEQSYTLRDAGKVVVIPEASLPSEEFKDTFVEAANSFLIPGGTVAVPILVDPLVLYWNRDVFATNGLAEPPVFWSELFTLAERMSKKTPSGTLTKSTIAFGEYQNVENAKAILATLILQAGGTVTARDSAGILAPALVPRNPGAERAAESALRFYTEFSNPAKDVYSWNRALRNSRVAFSSGDLALYVGYASEASLINSMNPNLNYGVALLPQTKDDRTITSARVYGLAVSRQSKNPGGAMTAAFLLGSKEPERLLSDALGIPAARRDVLSGSDGVAAHSALIANSWLDPDPERTAILFRAMIENVTSGVSRLTEAVQRADQELGQIIGL